MGGGDRIGWLDGARGIAIVMVVVTHAVDWTSTQYASPVTYWIHAFNRSAELPLLFCVAGIFAAPVVASPLSDVWRRRIYPLLWVYVLWQPVVFTYKLIANGTLVGPEGASIREQIARLALFPVRPSGELWFLWALALYLLIAHATRRAHPATQLGVAAAVFVAWNAVTADAPESVMRVLGPGLNGAPTYYLFFAVGALFAARLRGLADHRYSTPAATATVAAWALVVAMTPDTPLTKVAGLAGGLALAILLQRITALAHIGRHSLAYYLPHTAAIVLVAAWGTSADAPPLVVLAAAVAAAVGAGVALEHVAGRKAQWLLRPTAVRRVSHEMV